METLYQLELAVEAAMDAVAEAEVARGRASYAEGEYSSKMLLAAGETEVEAATVAGGYAGGGSEGNEIHDGWADPFTATVGAAAPLAAATGGGGGVGDGEVTAGGGDGGGGGGGGDARGGAATAFGGGGSGAGGVEGGTPGGLMGGTERGGSNGDDGRGGAATAEVKSHPLLSSDRTSRRVVPAPLARRGDVSMMTPPPSRHSPTNVRPPTKNVPPLMMDVPPPTKDVPRVVSKNAGGSGVNKSRKPGASGVNAGGSGVNVSRDAGTSGVNTGGSDVNKSRDAPEDVPSGVSRYAGPVNKEPFLWRGHNYLVKMLTDLSNLPLPMHEDPLLLNWFHERIDRGKRIYMY